MIREKRKENKHVRFIVEDLMGKLEKGNLKKGKAIRDAWAIAAGEKALRHTRPVSLKKGELVVLTEDSTWLYKLTLEKREILKRFNGTYTGRKKPEKIRFRIGSLEEKL